VKFLVAASAVTTRQHGNHSSKIQHISKRPTTLYSANYSCHSTKRII